MKITEKTYNAETGAEIMTERDETAAETKARLDRAREFASLQAQAQTAETAKFAAQAKLAALGLTTDDLKALGL